MEVLKVKNLEYKYGNKKGIENISFSAEDGEVVCILGKNGSGKSTLIKVLSTLYKPQKGSFFVFGIDAVKNRQTARRHIFTVFDESSHFDFLSGKENIEFFLKIYGSRRDNEINDIFRKFGINPEQKVKEYSFGMRRKLYLAQAILSDAEIIIVDEPSLGLDSKSKLTLFKLFEKEKKNGRTIIYATNRVEEAMNADRVIHLENGRIRNITDSKKVIDGAIKVKISFQNDVITDYILGIEELPELIKKYIAFGVPQKIEIAESQSVERVEEGVVWTKEAIKKVENAPKFLRKMIYKVVEKYANKRGYSIITPEVVEEAKKKFEMR